MIKDFERTLDSIRAKLADIIMEIVRLYDRMIESYGPGDLRLITFRAAGESIALGKSLLTGHGHAFSSKTRNEAVAVIAESIRLIQAEKKRNERVVLDSDSAWREIALSIAEAYFQLDGITNRFREFYGPDEVRTRAATCGRNLAGVAVCILRGKGLPSDFLQYIMDEFSITQTEVEQLILDHARRDPLGRVVDDIIDEADRRK